MPGSRRLDDLFHADAMQTPACGFVALPIGSFGKSYHTPKKILTAEDPFTQFLLEWIVRRGEAFFHISSIRSEWILPAGGRLPSGVKLIAGDPASALALASIGAKSCCVAKLPDRWPAVRSDPCRQIACDERLHG